MFLAASPQDWGLARARQPGALAAWGLDLTPGKTPAPGH